MKPFLLLTIGAIIVYVALSGKLPQVGAVLREAITPGSSSPSGSP